jgi:hypothetical protein
MVFQLFWPLIRILAHLALKARFEMHLVDVTVNIIWPGESSVAQWAWVTLSAALTLLDLRRDVGEK